MRAAAALDVERLRDAGLVVEAGFAAVELSAPPDAEAGAAEALGAEGLAVAGVVLLLRPWEPAAAALAALETALDAVEELADDDRALVPLLVAETDDAERAAAAGEVEQHRHLWTRGAALGTVLDAIHRAAERCQERGLVPAFLPRPGSAIESPREIDALANAADLDLVRLALDVEGLRRAGGEPPAFVAEFAEITSYVRLGEDAAVVAPLRAAGYAGWVTADVALEAGALAAARGRLAEAGTE